MMESPDDTERTQRLAEQMSGSGVEAVALTWVDNAGITRVKTVPIGRLVDAVA
jgi:glutamine synthetase